MSHYEYESRTTPEVLSSIQKSLGATLEDEDGLAYLERISVALEKIAEQDVQITQNLLQQENNVLQQEIPDLVPRASSREEMSKATGLCLADPADKGIREHSSVCILMRHHGGSEHKDNRGGLWLV